MDKNENKRNENSRNEHHIISATSSVSPPPAAVPVASMSQPISSSVWSGTEPKFVVSEKKLTAEKNKTYWARLYALVKATSASEEDKRKIRAAVYYYCAVNGSSRAGEYATDVSTAGGTVFNASCIVKACDIRDIRKWMRSNDDEAVQFFRDTGVLQKNDTLVRRAIDLGYSPDHVIGIVDFVSESSLLTMGEQRLSVASLSYGIQRSRGAREGKSLEQVEQELVERNLNAQNHEERGSVIQM